MCLYVLPLVASNYAMGSVKFSYFRHWWKELMNFFVADNNNGIPGRFNPKIFISWLHNWTM